MKTDDNLKTAFETKAKQYMKYLACADAAEKEGFVLTSKFFRALAEGEKVQALNHISLLSDVAETEQNIMNAIDNETHNFTQMYPSFVSQAEKDGNARAILIFKGALEAEKSHGNVLGDLLDNYKKDREFTYYVCTLCGNVAERYAPEKCPICNSSKDKYKAIE